MQYGSVFGRLVLPGFRRFQRPAMRARTCAHFLHGIEKLGSAGIELGAGALQKRLVKFDLARHAVQPDVRDVGIRIGGLS